MLAALDRFWINLFSNQTAFVPGRRGLDNVVVAQELIHSLDKKKGRVGFMAVKVDLVKA